MNSDTFPTAHWGSLQQKPLRSSLSDQEAAAPLTKGDLLIVAFVSSLWLWAATFAMISTRPRAIALIPWFLLSIPGMIIPRTSQSNP
jgi:hypothetical protein